MHIHPILLAFVESRLRSDRGASLVEYALLLALIAMVCIAAVTALGETTSASFSEAVSELG
ncbi:MAG: Flp family type IVb pilin [Acidimicrobiales bacterium]